VPVHAPCPPSATPRTPRSATPAWRPRGRWRPARRQTIVAPPGGRREQRGPTQRRRRHPTWALSQLPATPAPPAPHPPAASELVHLPSAGHACGRPPPPAQRTRQPRSSRPRPAGGTPAPWHLQDWAARNHPCPRLPAPGPGCAAPANHPWWRRCSGSGKANPAATQPQPQWLTRQRLPPSGMRVPFRPPAPSARGPPASPAPSASPRWWTPPRPWCGRR